ncbi:type II toxin-antitoxin system VapC family toxin [Galactobacter sp.]|uniref:type II toxin-antitoxin system VapC family toxin n=1 Tax=Galactobacter sp. TaxID=2676125 RepID=UPI0025BBEC36|nr:type II toxin-antitoxin system VapC family toxin [Galactobacter sp.]
MIVLDTTVVSEPLRPRPNLAVVEWVAERRAEAELTSVTMGELLYGAQRLPDGKRKRGLLEAIADLSGSVPILPYDGPASAAYSDLRAERESIGLAGSIEDLMIAGICLVGGHQLATRNVKDFAGTGVDIINPWSRG